MTTRFDDAQRWLTAIGHDQVPDLLDAVTHVLDMGEHHGWLDANRSDVIALGDALWRDPPRVTGNLTPVQALALASELFLAEVLPGDYHADHTTELVRRAHAAVTALAREGDDPEPTNYLRQRAAFAAVRQLGGALMVNLPHWIELALGDDTHWTACDHIIDYVALACANTQPGRRWRHVYQLGYITYRYP